MRHLRRGIRGAFPQLRAALAALALFTFLGATPAPHATFAAPKIALHSAFLVQTNKLGQVTHVAYAQHSRDKNFDFVTYSNAVQTFIRTPDGKAVAGTYRLTYDYEPQTQRIRREVALVKAGGVDPNAEGLANRMIDVARHSGAAPPTAAPHPLAPDQRLPSLQQILASPTPAR